MGLGAKDVGRTCRATCARASATQTVGFKSIESILKRTLDKAPLPQKPPETPPLDHDNIRGPEYYR